MCLQTPAACKVRRSPDPLALPTTSPAPKSAALPFLCHLLGAEVSLPASRRPAGGSRWWSGSSSTTGISICLLAGWKCSCREGILWLQHCSRMETVSAQFLTMLSHQLVGQTIAASLDLLMGPISFRTLSFLLCGSCFSSGHGGPPHALATEEHIANREGSSQTKC